MLPTMFLRVTDASLNLCSYITVLISSVLICLVLFPLVSMMDRREHEKPPAAERGRDGKAEEAVSDYGQGRHLHCP